MAVTGNIKILAENQWDLASLTLNDGTAVASLPLSNTQFYSNEEIARIASTSATIVANLDKRYQISTFNLYRHNLSNTATVQVQYYSGENGTGELVLDSGVLKAIPAKSLGELNWPLDKLVPSAFDDWHLRFTSYDHDYVIARSIKITIVDADNEQGYIDITRFYVGKAFRPAYNFSYGAGLSWLNSDNQQRSAGGGMFASASSAYRQIGLSLNYLQPKDRNELSRIRRIAGNNKDVFVSMYPNRGGALEIEHTMAGMFSDTNAINSTFNNNFTHSLTLLEV
jgi:hypothetical protein